MQGNTLKGFRCCLGNLGNVSLAMEQTIENKVANRGIFEGELFQCYYPWVKREENDIGIRMCGRALKMRKTAKMICCRFQKLVLSSFEIVGKHVLTCIYL